MKVLKDINCLSGTRRYLQIFLNEMFSHDLFIHSQRNIYISERQVSDKERPPSVRSISISSEEPHLLEVYKFFIICQCSNLISLSPIVINNDTFQWKLTNVIIMHRKHNMNIYMLSASVKLKLKVNIFVKPICFG